MPILPLTSWDLAPPVLLEKPNPSRRYLQALILR
jgi:hypothetical protein